LATGLSYGDITKACEDAIKDSIIHDREKVTQADLFVLLVSGKLFKK